MCVTAFLASMPVVAYNLTFWLQFLTNLLKPTYNLLMVAEKSRDTDVDEYHVFADKTSGCFCGRGHWKGFTSPPPALL